MNGNNLELNQGDNFIFGIDVSASMQTSDCPGNLQRIQFLKEKTITFCREASKYDSDGIDVIGFGQKLTPFQNVTADKASDIIGGLQANEPQTNTHLLVQKAFEMHKAGKYEQTVLFVATDGDPSDKSALKQAIIDITNQVTEEKEFTISVLTVGQISPGLRDYLTALDDELKNAGAKYDIVDVKALEEVDFMSAFVGAVTD